nr:hypothetical protein [Tanacetum cinerariifolium]
MDQQYPTVDKIPVLDTGKFKQWRFWIQQYLQHEHYAPWEVIEFGDSYTVPANSPSTTTTNTTSGEAGTKSGRAVTLTAEDMQKKKNDVKARTTLLLLLPDKHQLRFKGSETLDQTFNRLQVIVGQLQFMDIEIEQDDLNQKFLTSLAPEWLMHTIVWRNRSDLDTMSLDDLYNHLKGVTTVAKTGLAVGTTSLPVGTCSSAGVLAVGMDPLLVGTSTTPLAKTIVASMEVRIVAISSESSLIHSTSSGNISASSGNTSSVTIFIFAAVFC